MNTSKNLWSHVMIVMAQEKFLIHIMIKLVKEIHVQHVKEQE